MPAAYLHEHPEFKALLQIVAEEKNILPVLVEKDYWIMHVLYGLTKGGYAFELKGGTSLSKGYGIIHRFSEDIDIHITPPPAMGVAEERNKLKENQIKGRNEFYDFLVNNIKIDGIISLARDTSFDDTRYYFSGGIRLHYNSLFDTVTGIKDGILLEAGFDKVTPFERKTISSWAYEKAISIDSIQIVDNRAIDIACYDPGYTFVEKLQTIARMFRQEQVEKKGEKPNLMRQYYDVYSLLNIERVLTFIGTKEYEEYKIVKFKKDLDIPIQENQAFLLSDSTLKEQFKVRYEATSALYYNGQPPFEELLERLHSQLHRL